MGWYGCLIWVQLQTRNFSTSFKTQGDRAIEIVEDVRGREQILNGIYKFPSFGSRLFLLGFKYAFPNKFLYMCEIFFGIFPLLRYSPVCLILQFSSRSVCTYISQIFMEYHLTCEDMFMCCRAWLTYIDSCCDICIS